MAIPTLTIAEENMNADTLNAYDFSFQTIDGQPMPLSAYKGQVLLIVNTASQCGFTKQYKDLQTLYDTFQDQGLTVIGVPCNDFGNQEPGSEEEIKAFVSEKYGVTFPMTSKYSVKGDSAHPFFTWAKDENASGFIFAGPKWNFHKYLIDREGNLVKAYGSQVSPSSDKLISKIRELL